MPIRFLHRPAFLGLLVTLCWPTGAVAWSDTGHKVIAQIAWDNLDNDVRTRAVELIRAAPEDSDLSAWRTGRSLFVRGATWADIVRDEAKAQRHAKYHHGSWHYINYFWEVGANGEPSARSDLQPPAVNIVERLGKLASSLADPAVADEAKAIDLGWALHLVGDIHQPLHCTAQVTQVAPTGDRGGNLFELADGWNLHRYWDSALNRKYPSSSVKSIAQRIQRLHPKTERSDDDDDFAAWSLDGHQTAQRRAYPATLQPGRIPDDEYREMVWETAERRVALAGYRLAALLNRVLAP